MRRLIKHLGIIHNDLAGSCLDFIINLVTTSARSRKRSMVGCSSRLALRTGPGGSAW